MDFHRACTHMTATATMSSYQFLITWPHNKPITTQHNTFVERSITYVLVDLFFCSKNPSTHSQCAKMEGTIKRQIITNGRMRKAKYTVIISLCLLSVLYYVLAVKFYTFNFIFRKCLVGFLLYARKFILRLVAHSRRSDWTMN